jgi:hypothetical protein
VAATFAALLVLASCGGGSGSANSQRVAANLQAATETSVTKTPWTGPSVIIDTDLSKWWDDATAIGIANVLQKQDSLRVLGIVSDVPNKVAVAAINAIDTYYGHSDVPLGAMAGSAADTFEHGYTDALVARLPHSVSGSDDVPEAVALYRQLLAAAPDHSVTIAAIGGYTNLAGLLASSADAVSKLSGRELIAAKVARLVIMDGLFPNGAPALTNQLIDLPAAHAVVTGDWPTPIAWVDGFSGIKMRVGQSLCTEVGADHPLRIVFEKLFSCATGPTDGDWDAPTLLYAVGDSIGVFQELGQGGAAVINEQGGLSWAPSAQRTDDVYVHVVDEEALKQRIEGLLVAE